MSTKLYFFFPLLFFSLQLVCLKASRVHEANTHHHVFEASSLLPKTVCSSSSKDDRRSTLKVAHRHGPCALLDTHHDVKLTTSKMLEEDQSRASQMQSRISGRAQAQDPFKASAAQATLPARSGRSFGTGNYVVTIGIGTPKRDMTVIFDTGSDFTWIQCEPCAESCYSQQEKIFDPTQSSTYMNVSCGSAACTSLRTGVSATSCSSSTCVYGVQYGDQSYSVGFYGQEKLTLTSTDVFPNFGFGCGQRNNGLFGTTAGLLGLGRDKVSLVSQTKAKYGEVFSYCLPSTSSSTGYLTFGGYKVSASLKFTPLLTKSNQPSFYFINLIGIAVGGHNLPISPSVFSTAGTLIDSGTVITRLPPSAYTVLRDAFRKAMSKYPPAPPLSILDTCFDLSGQSTVTVPKIELQFSGGANVDIDFSGILLASSLSQVCLAFAGNSAASDVTIIGNKQQQTFEVIYDVAKGRLGFGSSGCS